MNEVIKALLERRAVRKFKPEVPAKEELEQVIEAGLYAASAQGKQNTIIVAVTNKELRDKLSAMNAQVMGKEGVDPFYGAPAILVVLAAKDWPNRVYDGSMVMGNMLNAAHAVGLGGIWIHRAKQEFETEEGLEILKSLGVEGEWEGIGHCALGYVDGELPKAAERKPGRVFWAE